MMLPVLGYMRVVKLRFDCCSSSSLFPSFHLTGFFFDGRTSIGFVMMHLSFGILISGV